MIKWCDRIVTGGLGFLIFFTPLAFGSVHPWAFALMEAVIFFLVIVWMLRIAGSRRQGARSGGQPLTPDALRLTAQLALPLGLFFILVLFQLLPLPPGLIHILSPATFEVYTHSLPGWTEGIQQGAKGQRAEARGQRSDISGQQSAVSRQKSEIGSNPQSAIPPAPVLLPTPDEVNSGAPVPFEKQTSEIRDQRSEGGVQGAKSEAQSARNPIEGSSESDSRLLTSDFRRLFFNKWLPLSLAPSQTRSDLFKLASYAALFFLVLLYPFAEGREQGAEVRSQRSEVRGQKARGGVSGKLISLFMKRKGRQQSAVSGHHAERREGLGVRSQRSEVRGQTSSDARGPLSVVSGRLLILITLSGLIVAAIGFIQRFTWNGKILWFFIPYDWSDVGAGIGELRASGPFIDPDHFANYLVLILPLALGFVIYSRYLFRKDSQIAGKIFFGMTLFVAFVSVLLSLSRGGWMTAVLGTGLLLWLGPARGAKRRVMTSGKRTLAVRGSLAIIAVLLILSLFFVGSGARKQVDIRLHETLTQDMGLAGRADVWSDTLKMVRDFPFFGVGLGSWQDLFQHYQKPPWVPTFYREAHNDYVEVLAETGIIGFVLLFLFFFKAGKQLFSSSRSSSDDTSSKVLVAMILAALATMTFHEFFDFNLQIPANAFLFTVLLAIGVRRSANAQSARSEAQSESGQRSEVRSQWSVVVPRFAPYVSRLTTYGAIVLAIVLIAMACRQEMTPYPYNLTMPGTVAEANAMVLAHPALSTPHVYLVRLSEEKAPAEWQLNQVRAALWLNPNDPFIHDQYARLLLGAGKQAEGLSEVTQSVFNAPSFAAHYYLNGRLLPWLSPAEKNAVESGFKKANALDYPEAMESLAAFYAATDRFADQGKLFEEAAGRARESTVSADLFTRAAAGYLKAGEDKNAEMLLRKAAAREPKDPRSYQMLVAMVYGPRKEVANISKTISEGVKNGAPAFDLYLALAEAAQKAGALDESKKALTMAKDALRTGSEDGQQPLRRYYSLAETAQNLGFRDEAISALLQALEFRSSSTETLLRLANLYLQDGNFDRAAYYFRSYIDINPAAADAFYHLALAEERQYRFAAAEAAYKRAVELAPEVQGYRQGYEALRAKVAQNKNQER